MLGLLSHVFQNTNAETTTQHCLGCINNTSTQILTIFNFQTEDYPFLGGNATFIVTPNPFAHTTNATDYLDLTTWFNFVVTDGGKFDSDPTLGIIEIVGVNNGTYNIMQIKGTSGFGLAQYPEASDEIAGTTGFAYVTQTFVNFTQTSSTVEPPFIDDTTLDKLKNTGGAKINGVQISNANDLPPAKIVTKSQILTATPPNPVVFTKTFSPSATPSTLINTLGIPTYSPPTDTLSGTGTAFMPPVFVAPVASGGGNFIITPVMDIVMPGSNIVIRADQVDQGTEHPLLKAINLPMNAQGSNVGITTHVSDEIPSGEPSIPSGFVGLYLNFEATGDIDFSDPDVYNEDPSITFTLSKVGTTCPIGVTLYLEDGGHWHSKATSLNPTSTDAHTCTYSVDVEHFSSYLVGTGNADVGTHDHGSSHDPSHDSHDSLSHEHTGHTHISMTHDEHFTQEHPFEMAIMEIIKSLKIYEIQYSLETGTAQIIVGTTGPVDNLEIQIHGRVSGFHTAKLAKINPFDVFNKQSHSDMNKYVFEVPIDPQETYFRISVDDSQYTLAQTVSIDGVKGRVIPWYAQGSESAEHLDHEQSQTLIHPAEYVTKFDGGIKTVTYNDMPFPIKYDMAGAITGIKVDEASKSVTFLLTEVAGGQAIIQIQRNLIDAVDDNFVVMVTTSLQKQIDYKIISSTSDSYTLQVDLPEGATSLIVMGTAVVPEFGFLAPFILSMAIVPILLIRKRSSF